MIHELVEAVEELVPRAKAWILENKDNEEASIQPWDRKGFKIPGGNASSPKLAQLLMAAPAMLSRPPAACCQRPSRSWTALLKPPAWTSKPPCASKAAAWPTWPLLPRRRT